MSLYTKPLYEAEKQLVYEGHLRRLEKITSKKVKAQQSRDTI